jgi:hypothetical protein
MSLHLAEGRVSDALSEPNPPLLARVKRAAVQAVLYSVPHVHLAYVYVLYAEQGRVGLFELEGDLFCSCSVPAGEADDV